MTDEVKGLGDTSEATRETLKEVLGEEGFNDLSNPKVETPEGKQEVKTPEQTTPKVVEQPEVKTEEKQEEVVKPKSRRSDYVPVSKYNELRHELQEIKKTLEQGKPPTIQEKKEVKSSLKDLAEKYNLDEDFISEFTDKLVEEAKVKLPDNFEATIKSFQEKEKSLAEDKEFENEFDTLIKDIPDLEASKADFKRLAFTEGYENTPLEVLATYYLAKNKPVHTAETPKQGGGKTELIDFQNITEEQLKGFDDEKLEQYMTWTKKQSGNYNG